MKKNIIILLLMIICFILALFCIVLLFDDYNTDKYIYYDRYGKFGYSAWCRDYYCVDNNNKKINVVSFDLIRKDR